MLVQRVFFGARWIVWDHGEGVFVSDRAPEVVGVVGRVGHDDFGRQALDQGGGLSGISALTGGEGEPDRAS